MLKIAHVTQINAKTEEQHTILALLFTIKYLLAKNSKINIKPTKKILKASSETTKFVVLKNEDIKEIAEVFVDKKYAGKTVQDMEEANQLTVFLILREDFSILPQKDTILRMNDIIVIRDENENS